VEHTTIQVGELRFEATVDGPPGGEIVLFLHGFPESRHEWRLVMPVLAAAGYRCVAIDQRGYSPGARPEGVAAYHVRHLVQDVVGVADALDEKRVHVVGHDWGAIVGWCLAAAHPARVRSAALLSVPHPRAYLHALRHDRSQVVRSSYVGVFRLPKVPELLFLARNAAGLRRALGELPADLRDAHVATLTQPGAMTAALDYYRAVDWSLAETPPVVVPTLHVWSTGDVALGRTGAEATGRWVGGPYRFEVLEGVSHWVPEVAPDRVAALLLEHLASAR
jgi:pimeloyl-ACP methyl ester carboxylesterase